MQIYFIHFVLFKWSDVSVQNAVAFTVDVITVNHFLMVFFLAMDGEISKTKRKTAEIIIILMALLLTRCALWT